MNTSLPHLDVQICSHCQFSLSSTLYPPLHPNDLERAFTGQNEYCDVDVDISSAQRELITFDAEMHHMEAALKILRSRKEQLQGYVQRRQVLTRRSPIRCLPTEVLSIVFTFACDSPTLENRITALAISVTCFRWRNIAISLPELWCNIYVGRHLEEGDIFALFLGRLSIGHPISLRVDHSPSPSTSATVDLVSDTGPNTDDSTSYQEQMLERVWNSCQQWRALDLSMSISGLEHFTKYMRVQWQYLPLLECLTIHIHGALYFPLQIFLPKPSVFKSAPKLHVVKFVGAAASRLFEEWNEDVIRWSRIDEITLDRWELSQVLSARGFDGENQTLIANGMTVPPIPHFRTPTLTTLILRPSVRASCVLLEDLNMPNLLHFTFEEPISTAPCGTVRAPRSFHIVLRCPADIMDTLSEFLRHSGRNLESLNIQLGANHVHNKYFKIPRWSNLLDILRHTPSLERLTFGESRSGTYILHSGFLRAVVNDVDILRRLWSVQFVWSACAIVPAVEAIAFLEKKIVQPGPLETDIEENDVRTVCSVVLGIRSGRELPLEVTNYMQTLRMRGIHASIW